MAGPKVGDKLFVFGRSMELIDDISDVEYNSIIGYRTVGGYDVWLEPDDDPNAAVPGFVIDFSADFWFAPCLTGGTSFSDGLLDVTSLLARNTPRPIGTRVFVSPGCIHKL